MRDLFKNVRFWLLIILVILSICLIHPSISDGKFQTNLNFGLDLSGGSYLRMKPDAMIIGVDLPTSKEESVADYLEKKLDTTVTPVYYGGEERYEVRKIVEREKLEEILGDAGGHLTYYDLGITKETLDQTKRILEDKLNMLGVKDIVVRTMGDKYLVVDLAGVNLSDAERIVSSPGVFELRIETEGGETKHILYGDDILSVDPMPTRLGYGDDAPWGAGFTLSEKGADKFREATLRYGAVDDPERHPISMLLDGKEVYSAPLSPGLASHMRENKSYGLVAQTGIGEEGKKRAGDLIIHLSAGALPVRLSIDMSGQVPATLGEQFKKQIGLMIVLALIAVSLITGYRYKRHEIVLPMLITTFSEVIIILGFASMPRIGWQLDIPSLAGIIAVIGTGIDQLIVITDEVIKSETPTGSKTKKKTKKINAPKREVVRSRKGYERGLSNAFKIIVVSAATTIFAMAPLLFMGLGKLSGFALTTIVGVLIGILVTRPAYGEIIKETMASGR